LFSLPAGWLGDRWSRRNMMAVFYMGSGFSLVAAALAPTLPLLAVALFALGIFASIYHPVGTALVLERATQRGRTMAFNAIAGNLGLALTTGVSAVLTAVFSWRAAFLLPGCVCIIAGAAYLYFIPEDLRRTTSRSSTPEVGLSGTAAVTIFALLMFVALCAGLVVNSVILSIPKIVDERVMGNIPLMAVGGLATAIFLCGALAQIAVGRLAERIRPHLLFVLIAILQLGGVVWAVYATGLAEIVALAVTMAAILAQVTVNDLVIARYTPDAWRSRAYAVRYCLTFLVSGVSAWMIAYLYSSGGFAFVLGVIAIIALCFLIAVLGVAFLAAGSENSLARATP
jgi:predicted MFS family arabinose efflux permease